MRELLLPGTEIRTTQLGFGCAGLMRVATRTRRQALLCEAYDCGIRHFDVARMYGLGEVEAEVGRFIKGRRDNVVIASKFGIEVKSRRKGIVALQGVARRIIALSPRLRRLARRKSKDMYLPRKYDVETARKSLQASLRQLGTDHLDILFLHEPSIEDLVGTDIFEFLEKSVSAGLIRAYGVAGYPGTLLPISREMPELVPIIQMPNDAIERQAKMFEHEKSAMITFSPYSTALEVINAHMHSSKDVARRWSEAVSCDMTDCNNIASFLLKYCLWDNMSGVVLFASTRSEHIKAAAIIADDSQRDQNRLQAFIKLVDSENWEC